MIDLNSPLEVQMFSLLNVKKELIIYNLQNLKNIWSKSYLKTFFTSSEPGEISSLISIYDREYFVFNLSKDKWDNSCNPHQFGEQVTPQDVQLVQNAKVVKFG